MGWLEERASEKGFRSLRALAVDIVRNEPDKVAYLANRVRDFDKGKDLGWWEGTGRQYLDAIAAALGEHATDLMDEARTATAAPTPAEDWTWSFNMFPGLRAIDLRTEAPFPGIPQELTQRGGPKAAYTWWIAPPGAGKTLLGRWLEIRYGWVVLQCATWSEAVARLPSTGSVYVELTTALHELPEPPVDVAGIHRLCVAAAPGVLDMWTAALPLGTEVDVPADAPSGPEAVPDWEILDTPGMQEWLPALLDWVIARIPRPDGFQPEAVRHLLADNPFDLVTPGAAIDLFGAFDEMGVPQPGNAGEIERLAVAWLRAAVDRRDRAPSAGAKEVHRRDGAGILTAAVKERYRRGLGASLPRGVWAVLIQGEPQLAIEPTRLYALTQREDAKEALAEIRSLLGSYGGLLVAGLVEIGALGGTPEASAVEPRWLEQIVGARAFRELRQDGGTGPGTLALHPETALPAFEEIYEELLAGDWTHVRGIVDRYERSTPEHVAALDVAVRAVGLALDATSDAPGEVLEQIWRHATAASQRRFDNLPPIPVVGMATTHRLRGVGSLGCWFVGMFTLSHWLARAGRAPDAGPLQPWTEALGAADSEKMLEALAMVSPVVWPQDDGHDDARLTRAAFRVGGDLAERLGVVLRGGRILDVQRPHAVVALATGAGLQVGEADRDELLGLPYALEHLATAARRQGTTLPAALAWCWQTWSQKPGAGPPFLWAQPSSDRSAEDLEAVWSALPAGALSSELYRRACSWPDVFRWIPRAAWEGWLGALEAGGATLGGDTARSFEWMPEDLALGMLRAGKGNGIPSMLSPLWKRMPEALVQLVHEMAALPGSMGGAAEGQPASGLVWHAPDHVMPDLVQAADAWLSEPAQYPGTGDWVRRWLLHVIDARKPGWREAFRIVSSPVTAPSSNAAP